VSPLDLVPSPIELPIDERARKPRSLRRFRIQTVEHPRPWSARHRSWTYWSPRVPSATVPLLAFVSVGIPAVGLRLWHLTALGLNSDEAVYAGQAASLAKDPNYLPYFPVFRAHPLLFQMLLSVQYRIVGVSELGGRLMAVAFGLGLVAIVYLLGKLLYDRRVGYVAALIVAVMPYLVVVNRQVLLDGPMTFFATLALLLLAKYVHTRRTPWLYAAASALGLTVLSKETAILLFGGVYAFFALTPAVRVKLRQLGLALAIFLGMVLLYPISVTLSGAKSTGGSFLVWQLMRRANHGWSFYASVVPPAIGWPVVVAAAAGLWLLRRNRSWRESLLLCWITGPLIFFEVWAVKGYQYLLPIAAPVAVLAARALIAIPADRRWSLGRLPVSGSTARVAAVLAVVLLVGNATLQQVAPSNTGTTFLAGTGGVAGGREAGTWIRENVPENAQILAIGPSMANIVQYYGRRQAFGLSVSPNPLHRNPVYTPIDNPDLKIRDNDLQYLVWDSYTAGRTSFFAERLLAFARRYHGEIVHTESITVVEGGRPVSKPVIVVFRVRP